MKIVAYIIERLRREREEDDDKWTHYEDLYVQARGQIVDLQLEIERLRQAVDALQLDRRDLEDVISVLEQEQRRACRYLEDARDELAHGRIQSAEHRIIDALVSLSSKERRTDTRLKTAVKGGGGCD